MQYFKKTKIKPNGSDDCVNREVDNVTNNFIKIQKERMMYYF